MPMQFSASEIIETIRMVQMENLDIRTITMGISLRDCSHPDLRVASTKAYDKICRLAGRLVAVGDEIQREYGMPIINKRVSVTPAALVAESSDTADYAALRAGARPRGESSGRELPRRLLRARSKRHDARRRGTARFAARGAGQTERVCASVNVGSTRAGINMDAVAQMGRIVCETARLTAAQDGLGCAKLVVFCNAVDDNPFMAGAFHGIGEPECVINVGVSGPGVVLTAVDARAGCGLRPARERHQAHGVQDHPHGRARGPRRVGKARRAVRHRRSVACAHTNAGRQRGAHSRSHGAGAGGHARLDRRARIAERRREERRRHGVEPRRRPVRRVHSGVRGCRDDRSGAVRRHHVRQARSDDMRLLGGPRHDCGAGRHAAGNHRRDHRG